MKYKVKAYRAGKGISQEALSSKAGISRGTLLKIEKGNIDGVKLGYLKKIASALDCSVKVLFFDEDEQK